MTVHCEASGIADPQAQRPPAGATEDHHATRHSGPLWLVDGTILDAASTFRSMSLVKSGVQDRTCQRKKSGRSASLAISDNGMGMRVSTEHRNRALERDVGWTSRVQVTAIVAGMRVRSRRPACHVNTPPGGGAMIRLPGSAESADARRRFRRSPSRGSAFRNAPPRGGPASSSGNLGSGYIRRATRAGR